MNIWNEHAVQGNATKFTPYIIKFWTWTIIGMDMIDYYVTIILSNLFCNYQIVH
jgi:hypothetical protein